MLVEAWRRAGPETRRQRASNVSAGDREVRKLWPAEAQSFSVFAGGPLFHLLRRTRLSDDGLGVVWRRVVLAIGIAWLPLFALSALQGRLFGADHALLFLSDIDCQVRFLIVVPTLLVAEPFVHGRMSSWVMQFYERGLVPEDAKDRVAAALDGALRMRDSVLAEVLLIALVYGVGIFVIWRHFGSIDVSSWYAAPAASGAKLTLAGLWYVWLSLPLFQFLVGRWFYQLLIWARFLWGMAKIRLNLLATHPDRAGGLGFLSSALRAFMPLAFAGGAMVSGQIANRILYTGAKLQDFIPEALCAAVLLVCLFAGPLALFAPQLSRVRRTGLREFGALAQVYVQAFDRKWLRGGAPADEPLIGSGDLQSLADLGNSYGVVERMRLTPMSRQVTLEFIAAFLAPITPLGLTIMPVEKLLQSLAGLIL